MPVLLSNQVHALLQESKIAVSHKYLEKLLLSHPDYPSLLSITDTLDKLGIESASLVVDKERLQEIPVPFLAHLNVKGNEFVVVNEISKVNEVHPQFQDKWDGIIVAVEKSDKWLNEENETWIRKEKVKKTKITAAIVTIVALVCTGVITNFSLAYTGILLTSLIGLGISVLIVQQELGISNPLIEQVCGAGIKNDCKAVLKSNGASLFNGFDWADAGIIYFSSFSVLHLLAVLSGSLLTAPAPLFAAAAVPFIIYSVYYQWRVVKKWCRLCLATVSILLIQAALYWPQIISYDFSLTHISQWLPAGLVLTLSASAWLLWIKPFLKKQKDNREEYFGLVRFKNNANVFTPLLQQQRVADITTFPGDIEIGNPHSSTKIVVACNPYCGPCARAHMLLHTMVEKNDISLRIRFTFKIEEEDDKKTIAVKHMLEVIAGNPGSSPKLARQMLHDWFTWIDYEKFKTAYPVIKRVHVNETMNAMVNWTRTTGIKFTPTVFVNGFELPPQYNINELDAVLKELPAQSLNAVSEEGQYTPV